MNITNINDEFTINLNNKEVISLEEVFDILNRKSGLLGRSEEEMIKIINDEENEFPDIYYSVDTFSSYKSKKLSHNGKKIFLIRVDFYNWCEEREIPYMLN